MEQNLSIIGKNRTHRVTDTIKKKTFSKKSGF